MKIKHEQHGKYCLVRVKGRLDAAWADFFADEVFQYIRNGQHDIVIDASEIVFLSSAGIRSLLRIFKELNTVKGSFLIVNSTKFVEQTLKTIQFQTWLGKDYPEDMPRTRSEDAEHSGIEQFTLNAEAMPTLTEKANWQPWQTVTESVVKSVAFSKDVVALGIGSSAGTFPEARDQFGEFLAVSGNVVYQLPDEQGHPDYLIAEKQYIPQMQCIQLLFCKGELGYLCRVTPTEKVPFYPISVILKNILAEAKGEVVCFVMLGEIEGLVGSFLIRSPGLLEATREIAFPEIRDWLSFCGERSYAHQQALIVGVAGRSVDLPANNRLPVVPSCPEISAHLHGAVFPYQPLQNGKIELATTVQKIFNGPQPLAVMHLTDDNRPITGLGETALVRGACWFGPLQNPEVLL